MKVIVTGKGGQLASEFEALKGFDSNWTFLSEKDLDITRRDSVLSYFNLATCDLIINCAAFTAVDKVDASYKKEYESGVRFDDRGLNINWEIDSKNIKLNTKDNNLPYLK